VHFSLYQEACWPLFIYVVYVCICVCVCVSVCLCWCVSGCGLCLCECLCARVRLCLCVEARCSCLSLLPCSIIFMAGNSFQNSCASPQDIIDLTGDSQPAGARTSASLVALTNLLLLLGACCTTSGTSTAYRPIMRGPSECQ